MAETATMDSMAARIESERGRAAMVAFLTNFSVQTADQVVADWELYYERLFVKYRDGLIVSTPPPPAHPRDLPPPPDCSSPGYSVSWVDRVVADTGDRYLIPPPPPPLRAHAIVKANLLARL